MKRPGSWADAQAFSVGRDCAARGMAYDVARFSFHHLFTRKSIERAFQGGWEAETAQRAIHAREYAIARLEGREGGAA
jgi:hypothetical protein